MRATPGLNTDNQQDGSMPLILGFDTSGAYCAAALVQGETVLAHHHEDMGRGQAERLIGLLEDVLAQGDVKWRDLSALGVGIGPGNFTGIRISVSAARGLALGLNIPAVGVGGCEARAALWPNRRVAIPAPRDQVYLCDPADPRAPPRLMSASQAAQSAENERQTLQTTADPGDLACSIAHIAAARWQITTDAPAPLYIRAADAAPSRDTAPVLLD